MPPGELSLRSRFLGVSLEFPRTFTSVKKHHHTTHGGGVIVLISRKESTRFPPVGGSGYSM